MNHMESAKSRLNSAQIVGRQHGTAFFFSKDDCNSFLDHMQNRYRYTLFDAYCQGFMQGLDGNFRVQYRYLKVRRQPPALDNSVQVNVASVARSETPAVGDVSQGVAVK